MPEPGVIETSCKNCGEPFVAIPDSLTLTMAGGRASDTGKLKCWCGALIELEVSEDGEDCEIVFPYRTIPPAELQ